jgi:uncharacterized small protein (DUF1192 family)
MQEEEIARPKREVTIPRPLAGLSVAELEAYVALLREEIARVEAEMGKARDLRSAAEALFKRPAD